MEHKAANTSSTVKETRFITGKLTTNNYAEIKKILIKTV
ncbi:hypothetical protein C942_04909 [Photobacterium marinum]|uniref:Uncharacterized protein n=1 Tax=Photobacterium marinum TaxID=1056511 RepID=L8JFR7_9GAMM|nr:hypothetical protein C942_04909 [Photobacterium marinum]